MKVYRILQSSNSGNNFDYIELMLLYIDRAQLILTQ